jgi:hypothetical protein
MMRILVTFVGCLFLLVPIILLYFLHSGIAKLTIIICSMVAFSAVTAAFTSAKNWEVIAAIIAYVDVVAQSHLYACLEANRFAGTPQYSWSSLVATSAERIVCILISMQMTKGVHGSGSGGIALTSSLPT